jgi:hypothetical protein
MRETVTATHCPTVPLPGRGTVGQSISATDESGTPSGTASGTASLKALAKLVLQRDRGWDKQRDSSFDLSREAVPFVGLSPGTVGQHETNFRALPQRQSAIDAAQKAPRAGACDPPVSTSHASGTASGTPPAPILAPATPEQAAEEVTDRAAIVEADGGADPARWRLVDHRAHAALLRRLQDAPLQRPPSWWATQSHRPAPGAWCSCCRGHRWCTRDGGQGWCCQICHPAPGQGVGSARYLRQRLTSMP